MPEKITRNIQNQLFVEHWEEGVSKAKVLHCRISYRDKKEKRKTTKHVVFVAAQQGGAS